MREDNGNVADFSHYGIRAVGLALPKAVRMNMDVSNNGAVGVATTLPEVAEPPAVDFDNAVS